MKRLIAAYLLPGLIGAGVIGGLLSARGLTNVDEDPALASRNWIMSAPAVATCDTVFTSIGTDSVMIVTCTDTVAVADRFMWAQDVTMGPDGYLYVGTYWDVGAGDYNAWYMLDLATGAVVDSFGTGLSDATLAGHNAMATGDTLYAPRGAAWNATGDTMYTADFDGQVVKKWAKSGTTWSYVEDFYQSQWLVHGVAVDPDNKVWIGFFAATDTLGAVNVGTLRVFNQDGTENAMSPFNIATQGGVPDTITAFCRGLTTDNNGNILFSGSGGKQLYRFNYSDGTIMNKTILTNSFLTKAGEDTNGFVYVGHVLNGNPITVFDSDFVLYNTVTDAMPFLSRSLQVSEDGNDVYVGAIYAGVNGIRHYHSDNGADGPYVLADTIGTQYHFETTTTVDTTVLGIEGPDGLPQRYLLSQNFPNPFNPETWIHFALPKTEPASVVIYDLLGHKVRTLVNDMQVAGNHTVVWDGSDDNGARLSSGIYIYRLQTRSVTLSKKMVLMK